MKTTIVPAQITTIEDKIAGSLGLSQLLLLAAPVFIGTGIFTVFPPLLHFSPYKLVLIVLTAFLCSVMAIRVKGKILLLWAVVIVRYNLRPRYYVFDKNDDHLRERPSDVALDADDETSLEHSEEPVYAPLPQISPADTLLLEQIIDNPETNISFRPGKRGGIDVLIAEVER
jgi:hypothetical protein